MLMTLFASAAGLIPRGTRMSKGLFQPWRRISPRRGYGCEHRRYWYQMMSAMTELGELGKTLLRAREKRGGKDKAFWGSHLN